MQFETTSRAPDLQMRHVEEAYTRDPDGESLHLVIGRFRHELVEHAPGSDEPVVIWRRAVAAPFGIVRLDDQPLPGNDGIFENDVKIVVRLAFDTCNPADDLVDAELFVAHAVIARWTTVSRNLVERSHRGSDHGVELHTGRRVIAKALHVGSVERAGRREHGANHRDERVQLVPYTYAT